jgi:hypothetical protein
MIRVLLDMLVGDERSIRPGASDMDQKYVLYYTTPAILRGLTCNAGIDEALERIKDLRRQGLKVRVEDTAHMSENELQTAYIRVTTPPSVMKKYPIRRVFGSRRHAGFMFGRGVPALVVYSESREMAEDVFPHEESGRIMTINEFLSRLHAV